MAKITKPPKVNGHAAADAAFADEDEVIFIDVLANDGGSTSSQSIYSVNQTSGGQAVTTALSTLGATVTIVDGRIRYEAGGKALQALAEGEVAEDSFTYVMQLGNGVRSVATVTVTVVGSNDAPVVTGVVTGTAVEDGAVVSLDALANARDVDRGAVLRVTDIAPLPSGVSFDAATQRFTLDPAHAALNGLAAGEVRTVTVSYKVSDGMAAVDATASWTVTGTNDAPAVAGAVTAAATEDGAPVTVSALATAGDVDGDALTAIVDAALLPAGVSYDAATQSFHLLPAAGAFQNLAEGETRTLTIDYQVTDGLAAPVAAQAVFTVTGVNDAPVLDGLLEEVATEDGGLVTIFATDNVVDADRGKANSGQPGTALRVVDIGALPPGVTFIDFKGIPAFRLDSSDAAYQSLAAGETRTVSVAFKVSDGLAAPIDNVATWTITGTNDAPVVTGAVTGTAVEDGAPVALSALANASDIDSGAALSVVDVGDLPPGVTFDAATQRFTLDPGHPAYQSIAAGDTRTVTVAYKVSDGSAATDASASWTIIGVNDVPVVEGPVTGEAVEDGPAVLLFADENTRDADKIGKLEVALTVVDVGALPPGVTVVDVKGGGTAFRLDPGHAAYQNLAAGETRVVTVTYAITDGLSDPIPTSASWTITGTNDAPVIERLEGDVLTYIEGRTFGDPIYLDAGRDALLTDIDNRDFAGGTLAVRVVNKVATEDFIAFLNAPDNGFGFAGNTLFLDGRVIGSFNTLDVGVDRLFTFTDGATVDDVQRLVRIMGYFNGNQINPDTTPRVVEFKLTDPDGGVHVSRTEVRIIDTPEAPSIAGLAGDVLTYVEGQTFGDPIFLDAGRDAIVRDESGAGFAGGSLVVRVVNEVASEDFIYFLNGSDTSFTFSGNRLLFDGIEIATFNAAGAGVDREFIFNGNADAEAIQRLVRIMGYANGNQGNPDTSSRTVEFVLTDAGGGSQTVRTTVNVVGVDDPAVLRDVSFETFENSPLTIRLSDLVSDPDGLSAQLVSASVPAGFGTARIEGGTIVFEPGRDFDRLPRFGEADVALNFTVRDLTTGQLLTAQRNIKVVGENDPLSFSGPLRASAIEDGTPVSVFALANAIDLDDPADIYVVPPGLGPGTSLPNGVTYNADTRTFTLDPKHPTFDDLAAGQTREVQVVIQIDDRDDGEPSVFTTANWVVTGVDDPIRVRNGELRTAENSPLTIQLSDLVSDPDGLSAQFVSASVPGGFGTARIEGGNIVFDPGRDFDRLALFGEADVALSFTVRDLTTGQLLSAQRNIEVVGENDPLSFSGPLRANAIENGAPVSLFALANAIDLDGFADVYVVPPGLGPGTALPAGVTYDPNTQLFTLDPKHPVFDDLVAGQTREVEVVIQVDDRADTEPSLYTTAKWIVTGVDAPPDNFFG